MAEDSRVETETPKEHQKSKLSKGLASSKGAKNNYGLSSNALSKSGVSLLRALREAYNVSIASGREVEALEALRQACRVKAEVFGRRSKWTRSSEVDFVKCANVLGTKLMSKGQLEEGSRVLLDAHELACRDAQAEACTLINISACMYSQELLEDSLKYLDMSLETQKSCFQEELSNKKKPRKKKQKRKGNQSSPEQDENRKSVFRAETHLNSCAAQFKLGDSTRAVFHGQAAVKFAQDQVRQYTGNTLPDCFRREALTTLVLSYHALATSLRAYGFETLGEASAKSENISPEIDDDNESARGVRGFHAILAGLKFHIKSFEQVSKINAQSTAAPIPPGLENGLWLAFNLACDECSDMAKDAIAQRQFSNSRPDLEFLCKIVNQQVAAKQIQQRARRFLLKRETRAALTIQRRTKRYLKVRRKQTDNAAMLLQARYRGHFVRKSKAENVREKQAAKERAEARARAQLKAATAAAQRETKRSKTPVKKVRTVTPKRNKRRVLTNRDKVLLAASIDQWKQIRRHGLRVGFLALKRNRRYLVAQDNRSAACTVQAQWRGYKSRNTLRQLQEGATIIQSSFRGHKQRKENKIDKISQSITQGFKATVVQDWWRSKMSSKKKQKEREKERLEKQLEREAQAAIKIQARLRGHSLRKAIADEEEAFDRHIVKIQSWVRGKQTRTRVEHYQAAALNGATSLGTGRKNGSGKKRTGGRRVKSH